MPDSRSPVSPQTPASECQNGIGVLVRLFWMFLGNMLLVILSLKIAQSRAGISADIGFWCIAVAMVVLRYIDITRLRGQTTHCARATMRDWWRYLACVAGAASALWVLGHTLFRQLMR